MINKVLDNINNILIGKEHITKLVVTALLAGGHILLEDVPGVGKTTLANALAKSVDGTFARIQFTPDTMPGDVTGSSIYNYEKHCFEYMEGAIMNHIILADEINRTSPKTQASLLEAMEEGQVTVDAKIYRLPQPFMVIATQNPVMQRGTYYLPESQLDRFMMKLGMGYPSREDSVLIVREMLEGRRVAELAPVVSVEQLLEMKEQVGKVRVGDNLIAYAAECIEKTREHEKVELGASPRALIAWMKAARAYAYIEGREYVLPDDLKQLAPYVLAHRLILGGLVTRDALDGKDIVEEILRKVKVPLER